MNYNTNPYLKSATGLEIKDWIWYNSQHQTKYSSIANKLINKFNIDNNKYYMIVKCTSGKVTIIEVDEKDKHYEIPCDD